MGYIKKLNSNEVRIVKKNGIKIITQIDKDKNFNGVIERANKCQNGIKH